MNIFILDTHPVKAAKMLCDKHIVKMVLETAQMLSTIAGGPYKPTHANHPCTRWAAANQTNFNWLLRHGRALCAEYTRRYGKVHKSEAVIESIAATYDVTRLPVGASNFVQAMPDEYKHKDPVIAYRQYYHSKARFAVWRYSETPFWWMQDEFKRFIQTDVPNNARQVPPTYRGAQYSHTNSTVHAL